MHPRYRMSHSREVHMTDLSRRTMLAGAAAATATAASLAPPMTPARAAASPTGKQAPGWYRYKVGDFEVTVVTDGRNYFKLPDTFVTNVKKDQVNEALAAAYMDKDMMTIPYKAAGIDRNAVDLVIISHFHGDHINGLLTPDKKPSFPNAEILVPAAEWKYFMDDGEMSRAPKGRMEAVFKGTRAVFDPLNRKVTPYEPGKELTAGITSVATNGHTPGHNSHIISSGSGKVYVQADVTNHPALFVRNPGWHAFFDQDAKMAEATRRKVYDMLVADKMLVQGFHYPFPALCHIEKSGNGYREIPVPWNPII
jgi:glyoxylase-like metal-dependent hydrolase (beta-lactamase superfamily II)